MKKILIFLYILSFTITNIFAFVPLSNNQLNLGSFREGATCGMFYDELDIISAHPVALLDYSGNFLYTTWGNARNPFNAGYNQVLLYNAPTGNSVDNTFVLGITGDPLKNFGLANSRVGLVFQNLGGKTNYFDLDNLIGLDSEGKWKNVTIQSKTNDVINREAIEEASLKYYDNRAQNQYNVGFAIKGILPLINILGFSIARQSDYTNCVTGGTKLYSVKANNDNGLTGPYTGLPSGTRKLDDYILTYADNDILINSFDQTDLLIQARAEELLPNMRLDVGVGLRIRNDYNPNSLTKNAHKVTLSEAVLNNAGNGVVYNTGIVIRDVVTATGGQLNYDDFSNLAGDLTNANLWLPLWATGIDAPALYDFKDNRSGIGSLIRTEAEFNLFNLPALAIFNLTLLPQKLDSEQIKKDYIMTKTYDTTTVNDPLQTWILRDYNQKIKSSGDIINTTIDVGLKLNPVKTDYVEVALGGFITSRYQLSDYTTKTNSIEITSYDDGIVGNNPGTVGINTRPSPVNGEGVWQQKVESETANKNETATLTISVPVGAEVPITKKWIFRAGTIYNMTKTKSVVKQTAGRITTITTVTPAGGTTTESKTVVDVVGDDLNESIRYIETHNVSYAYGIEWRPNPNLILACNAFLDTNQNKGVDTNADTIIDTYQKASIFDLDTYRLLAIQAIFKF
ncbi:MAG: hypothetical protein N2555_01960 [Endomicrobia bacterium]|nr:hypothetical protein [Endomicrobiia bacterium]